MAYHIFTMRKLMLTNEMNTTQMKMMQIQFKRDEVEDQLLEYYNELYGGNLLKDDVNEKFSLDEIQDSGDVKNSKSYDDLTETEKSALKGKILEAQREENHLDQLLKKYETAYSEAQNELKQVETQEAAAIKESVPHYGGVPQQ